MKLLWKTNRPAACSIISNDYDLIRLINVSPDQHKPDLLTLLVLTNVGGGLHVETKKAKQTETNSKHHFISHLGLLS